MLIFLLGKTFFLFYLLLYRLEAKLPTAIQLDPEYYFIFDEQGAIVHSLPDRDRDPRLRECWALTDSNDQVLQPCPAFKGLAKRVILASPPNPERWRRWIKQTNGFCILSDLPSVPEIAAIVYECSSVGFPCSRSLQERAQEATDTARETALVRSIFHSLSRAQVGTIDLEHPPQHGVRRLWEGRSHRNGSNKRCDTHMHRSNEYLPAIARHTYAAKRTLQHYFPSPYTGVQGGQRRRQDFHPNAAPPGPL
jgi:hypothetical protein